MSKFQKFFQSFEHRGYKFKNRIGLSAMTRCRADPDGTPNDLVHQYYIQRAESAGILSTEAMGVNSRCNPWGASCTVSTSKSIEQWKPIIQSVHKLNSYIFAQIVHGGRTVHPDWANGLQPMAPSPIACKDKCHTPKGNPDHVVPREMTLEDIRTVQTEFKLSVINAKEAGFDGVEFHGANGYLIDQFLRSGTNHRTDLYGGSIANRCRFVLELIDSALDIIPSHKIGIKISPVGSYQDMHDENPHELVKHLLTELQKREILYVVMGQAEPSTEGLKIMENPVKVARQFFKGLIISDGNIPIEERLRRVESGEADIANFGQLLWANPDLADRLKEEGPLNQPDFKFIYSGGAHSYTDIPKYKVHA